MCIAKAVQTQAMEKGYSKAGQNIKRLHSELRRCSQMLGRGHQYEGRTRPYPS